MRLTRIELENFKGVRERQRIDIRPVTLLFGANSAGKSTILQALHYVREILERQNTDPDQTLSGGLIDLGGFKALVYMHDLERPIRIKLVINLMDEQGSDWLPINSREAFEEVGAVELGALHMRYLLGEKFDSGGTCLVEEVGVELEVRWSEQLKAPYVSLLTVEINDSLVANIESPPQRGRAMLTDINFGNLLLRDINVFDDESTSNFQDEVMNLSVEMAQATEGEMPRISVKTVLGAMVNLDRPIETGLREVTTDGEKEEHTWRVRGLKRLLDELIGGPCKIVRDYLGSNTYIGPLREIPTRNFRPQLSRDESRWARGLAAWDLLGGSDSEKLLDAVNDWLSDPEKLGVNYCVSKEAVKEVPVHSHLDTWLEIGDYSGGKVGEHEDLEEYYNSLETRTDIVLLDKQTNLSLSPSDIGVGISQMLPVVVACLDTRGGLLSVEQPELHIHPRIQVGMGDLFIHAADSEDGTGLREKTLLIETHSEHIMLRLLRRIRETGEDELPSGVSAFSASRLSVIYVEFNNAKGSGTQYTKLRVDDDGEFIDRWPSGFFDERAEELF